MPERTREEALLKVGVIGYGYWGPNLVRNFFEAEETTVGAVCDSRPERLALVKNRYPEIKVSQDPRELIADPDLDAIAVATPASTHYELGLSVLGSGKHLLMEKPLAATTEEGLRLIDRAAQAGLVLMVDHTFVYTGAVRKMKELVQSGELGDIFYYDSVRVNLGLFQPDIDVMWDLAVHDLSVMEYVLPASFKAVSATGMSHVPGQPEDVAYLTIFFEEDFIAHIHVNWLSPVKIRKTIIGGSKKMVVFDDLDPLEKIKVYDKGIEVANGDEKLHELLIGYRTGDMWAPKLDQTEALRRMVLHFRDCIQGNRCPDTDGKAGLSVLKVLEAASRSIKDRGRLVEL